MPAADAMPERLKLCFASCQHFETGLFTAYEHMAAENPDLVLHLGDYIYEYEGKDNRVRKHSGPEITTIEHYRNRYAQYRLDPQLQTMHALCPWLVVWDDHEFDNNCTGSDFGRAGGERSRISAAAGECVSGLLREHAAAQTGHPQRFGYAAVPHTGLRATGPHRNARYSPVSLRSAQWRRTEAFDRSGSGPDNNHARRKAGTVAAQRTQQFKIHLERAGTAGDDGPSRSGSRRRIRNSAWTSGPATKWLAGDC